MNDLFFPPRITPKEAIELQKTLRAKIKIKPFNKKISYIGGADVSMGLFSKIGFAGFVTLSYPELSLIDEKVVKQKISFPYIPGLLSFREIPMLLKAWEKLKIKPSLILVDGQGIAHPRRMGIATHLGLILNIPTIGCAKSILIGKHKKISNKPGSFSYLHDEKNNNEIIGAAVRTKRGVKPIYISPGHLITLKESIEIIRKCVLKHRLPEPTRLAHCRVNFYRVNNKKD